MIGPSGGGRVGGPNNDDRLPPMNSQLALRVAIAGSVALLMFAVIFLRLWFLQVLTGHSYVAQAKSNITRPVSIPAARGSILASDDSTLVASVKVPAVLIQAEQLPVPLNPDRASDLLNQPPPDLAVYDRLARVLGLSTQPSSCTFKLTEDVNGVETPHTYDPDLPEIPCIIDQHAADITDGTVAIATDVPTAEQAYISEHQSEFTGIQVSQTSISKYPQGELAGQLLGTVGANSNPLTGGRLFKTIAAFDDVGNSGLEEQYNTYLQGTDGHERIEVNAQGTYQKTESPVAGTAGDNLKTSIDLPLEKVGDAALAESLQKSGSIYGGAFIAMDPQNGQVYAMGSLPSYNPQVFDKPLTTKQYDAKFDDSVTAPLLNRATQGIGPPGSTFKVITATAALESGKWTPSETYDDVGEVCPTPGDPASCVTNAPGDGAQGSIDLVQAIEVSDDDFFYNLGEKLNPNPNVRAGGPLQKWAQAYGVGERPDIDLPDASTGEMSTPGVVDNEITEERECATATGEYAYTNGTNVSFKPHGKGWHRSPKHPEGCGIAEPDTLGWTVGDDMNAAIGQGDDQLTPLQMAMVYSAVENGGTLVSPHIGKDIQTPSGQIVQTIDPKPERKLDINPTYLDTIRQGLEAAANGASGTSTDVMGNFPKTVYGKTGTADYKPTTGPEAGVDTAYAWYDCYVPASETSKPLEVTVWVEDGGYGDQTAAPVARELLSQWYLGHPGAYATGSTTSH
jgi:penicillin-binding protein 2